MLATHKSRRFSLSFPNLILAVVIVILIVAIVGMKAFTSGKGASGSDIAHRHSRRISKAINVASVSELENSEHNEIELLKYQLKGLKGPVNKLIEMVEEMRRESLTSMPYTRLQFHRNVDRSKTILVAIPNAHESTCMSLVSNIFETAKNKHQITVAIVETHEDTEDVDRDVIFHASKCVDPKYALCNQTKFCPTDHVRLRRVPASELQRLKRSVSWQRHISSMMYRNEKYFLLIDGSTGMFEQDWDEKLITEYKERVHEAVTSGRSTGAPARVILSGRIPSGTLEGFGPVCIGRVDDSGLPVYQHVSHSKDTVINEPQPLVSSEFLFTEGNAFFTEVPFDRYLYKLSTSASDMLLSTRLHTAGFITYLPRNAVAMYRAGAEAQAVEGSSAAAVMPPALAEEKDQTVASKASSQQSIDRFKAVLFDGSSVKDKRYSLEGHNVFGSGSTTVPQPFLSDIGLKVGPEGKLAMSDKKPSRCVKG